MPSDAARATTDTANSTLAAPPVRIERLALFLDMDGVLAAFASTPEAVVPNPRRTAVLRRLNAVLDGRMAVISGRTLAEIDRITEDSAPSASGVHGLERRRRDGSLDLLEAAPEVREAVATFKTFREANPGVIVEDKGVSAGLHYRQAPRLEAEALALAHQVAADTGLAIQPGDLVVELKTPGTDKGTALTAFMAEAPFKGAVPVMLGDDLTDEHAFQAAAALGGFGVLVGPGRETAAVHRLDGVAAVLDWLEAVVEAADEKMETPA